MSAAHDNSRYDKYNPSQGDTIKTEVTISIDSEIAAASDAYTLGLYAEQQFKATHFKSPDGWKRTTSESSHAGIVE